MPTLHLGVMELPYTYNDEHTTTGDVATILEEKYHLFETFYDLHEEEIAEALTRGVATALETALVGGVAIDPHAEAMSEIQTMFKTYLETAEIEGTSTPGVPTRAARRGVSHRRKHPYAKGNSRRPSFVDTGLLESSFVAWMDSFT